MNAPPSRNGIDDPIPDNALTCPHTLWHGICSNPAHDRCHTYRDRDARASGAGPESGSGKGAGRGVGRCAWHWSFSVIRAGRRELPLQLAVAAGLSGHWYGWAQQGRDRNKHCAYGCRCLPGRGCGKSFRGKPDPCWRRNPAEERRNSAFDNTRGTEPWAGGRRYGLDAGWLSCRDSCLADSNGSGPASCSRSG